MCVVPFSRAQSYKNVLPLVLGVFSVSCFFFLFRQRMQDPLSMRKTEKYKKRAPLLVQLIDNAVVKRQEGEPIYVIFAKIALLLLVKTLK